VSRLSVLRPVASVALALLGCLLCVVALVAIWGRDQILNTDRYLATVAPLASDPVIQDDVASRIAAAIDARLDAGGYADTVLPTAISTLASGHVEAAVHAFVASTTTAFVRSDAFAGARLAVNRIGHQELVAILRGGTTARSASSTAASCSTSPPCSAPSAPGWSPAAWPS
jgi:hypothetical protein